jgi:prepilin-type processing-associated H-X9-DG protein
MSVIATCSCGRVLSASDDWVGSSTICPACGARVDLPGRASAFATRAARACLALGSLALFLYLATLADLPNRVFPRSISRVVEETCTGRGYLASMAASLFALATAYVGRKAKGFVRTVGLLCASVPLAIIVLRSVNFGDDARVSAPRAQCVNNLKQIALAMANYEAAFGAFPPRVSRDPQGRPLLSWRVAILPFLEEQALYDRFHLDESWDSPHNRTLIDQIPSMFTCPSQAGWSRNQTLYQVLDGPGVFLDSTKPTRLGEIGDGPGETIAVVEAPSPVPWTSPRDVPFRPGRPFPAWEATHPGGFNASFVDGSVRFQKRSMPASELEALATRSGGEK